LPFFTKKDIPVTEYIRILKFQYLHVVKWVSGKVSILAKEWKCVTIHLETTVEIEKSNVAGDAERLDLRKLYDTMFIHTMYFLSDYLGIL